MVLSPSVKLCLVVSNVIACNKVRVGWGEMPLGIKCRFMLFKPTTALSSDFQV